MDLLVKQKRRILHITLNRPAKRNALTAAMCSEMIEAARKVQEGYEVGVILISATGTVFCSGIDLDEAVTSNHQSLASLHDELFSIGSWSRKPIVVAVNGAALGAGLGLVAQGHVVAASTGAAFGLPEIKMGLWPFVIFRSVERALGYRRTLELSLTGRLFYSQDAMQWGLVHAVCNPAEVLDRGRGFATDLAKSSPQAIESGLQYLQASFGKTPAEVSVLSKDARSMAMESADLREGYSAFKARRPPRWPTMPGDFYDHPELVGADEVDYASGQ